ncbi:MAG: DNA-processing protein DprA, partial [Pseudomonadota bacterium]
QLLAKFGSAGAALEALPGLVTSGGRKQSLAAPPRDAVAREIEQTEAIGGRVIAACDPDFPPALVAIDPPPPVLTVLGHTDLFKRPAIAIVGARNASAAGRKIARDMSAELSASGYVVVSGLARGIDGEAHAAALSKGTIAVLGGGIDHIYPPQHEDLYRAIASDGLVVSESPLGHRATAKDFPRRNRLVTGLALGTVVVEAAERSGSLISARSAGEQGREVMAVPGSPLDPRAAGTNRLIRQGAALVRSAEDVIEIVSSLGGVRIEAGRSSRFQSAPDLVRPPPEQVQRVVEALAPYPMPIDEIARAADIGPARCAAILMELELAGEAETLPGGLALKTV